VLDTPRLRLRPLAASDLEALGLLNADPEVMRHIGEGVRDRAETVQHLELMLSHWVEHGFGVWAIEARDSGRFLGRCGLQHYEHTAEIELSYALESASWGRGLMPEAAFCSLSYGFSVLGLARIIATVRNENRRSQRVLEKVGMRFVEPRQRYGRTVKTFAIDRSAVNR
jgi:RimJ/RimL family protein N-acetyltransferase